MRSPWSIIAVRSGHSCSVTSISLCAPWRVRPITRMMRSWSATKTRSASRISVDLVGVAQVEGLLHRLGHRAFQHQLAHVVAPEHHVQHAAVARSSLLRSGVTVSSGVASSASAASCAISRRFCR